MGLPKGPGAGEGSSDSIVTLLRAFLAAKDTMLDRGKHMAPISNYDFRLWDEETLHPQELYLLKNVNMADQHELHSVINFYTNWKRFCSHLYLNIK